MASHKHFQVIKRPDTPGPVYSIFDKDNHQTVGKSRSRKKANMSAGIRDSERERGK